MKTTKSFHILVWVILGGTVFTRIASFMAIPFLALYLHNTQDVHPILIGLTVGVAPLVSTIGGFIGGYLTDRFGRKKVILATIFVWSFVFIGFGLAKSIYLFIFLNALNGLCRSFFEPSTQALMIDFTEPNQRKRMFTLRYTAINIAGVIGPLLGAYIATVSTQSIPFFITGFMYCVYGVFLFIILNRYTMRQVISKSPVHIYQMLKIVSSNRALVFFILGAIFINIGYSQLDSTIPQFLEMNFENGVYLYSVIISLNAAIVILLQFPISLWSEKLSAVNSMTIGILFFVAGYILFIFGTNLPMLIVAITVITLGEIFTFPSMNILIDQIAPDDQKGTFLGAAQFRNIGSFAGPIIGGWLLTFGSGAYLFGTMALLVLLSIIFYRAGDHVAKSAKEVQRFEAL
ncbi:MDR family MFS transporter [Cytobacillus massiliigabonensis]|uniref:MDR family MFS transporter n=1 Tax=Cytobacillus massiliigabonensis TaxID=1871011 RepID=UPI000C850263|nr:MFS transporter [Cytobacillus massiliigabonensis]